MLKCLCWHCRNRSVGCNKFCPDYRKYRRELEAMQAEQQKANKGLKAAEKTYFKNNFRRK